MTGLSPPDRRRGPRPKLGEHAIILTPAQERDFAACAAACGLEMDRWVVECAAVQAAHVLDAIQATERSGASESRRWPRTGRSTRSSESDDGRGRARGRKVRDRD